jgi:C4-dicarboxylate transporter DctM subunit
MELPATWAERLASLKKAVLPLMLPPIIIGGIYTGVFTPTEAAGIGAGLSFLICFVIQRRLGLKDVLPILQDTIKTSSMLFMIMATAIFFGQVLTVNQIPQNVARWVVDMDMSKWAFLIFVNILLIFLGDFLEVVSIMLITIPIFFPVILELGIDPIWFAIIFIINMELALITPPVGLNLYVILGIVPTTIGEVLRGAFPFMILLAVALVLVIIFPSLSLWLQTFVQ